MLFRPGPCEAAVVKAIEARYPRREDLEGKFWDEGDGDNWEMESSCSVEAARSDGGSSICLAETFMALSHLNTASATDWDGLYVDENEEYALPEVSETSADQVDHQQAGGAQENNEGVFVAQESNESPGEANANAQVVGSGDDVADELSMPEGEARGASASTSTVGDEGDSGAASEAVSKLA